MRAVERLVRSLRPVGPSAVSVLGVRVDLDPPGGGSPDKSLQANQMRDVIYAVAHCRQHSLLRGSGAGDPHYVGAFVSALSHANSGDGCLQGGWTVVQRTSERVVASRAGIRLSFGADRFTDGIAPEPGATVSLRSVKEHRNLMPGYYGGLGNLDHTAYGPVVRLYWNLDPQGSVELTRALTQHLNASDIPFSFKVLSDPGAYGRSDAAVVYLPEGFLERAKKPLAAVYTAARSHLNPRTSFFANRLASGVAMSCDTGTAESFGRHRSRVLAEALARQIEVMRAGGGPSWSEPKDHLYEAMAANLHADGLSPEVMWRNGSAPVNARSMEVAFGA